MPTAIAVTCGQHEVMLCVVPNERNGEPDAPLMKLNPLELELVPSIVEAA